MSLSWAVQFAKIYTILLQLDKDKSWMYFNSILDWMLGKHGCFLQKQKPHSQQTRQNEFFFSNTFPSLETWGWDLPVHCRVTQRPAVLWGQVAVGCRGPHDPDLEQHTSRLQREGHKGTFLESSVKTTENSHGGFSAIESREFEITKPKDQNWTERDLLLVDKSFKREFKKKMPFFPFANVVTEEEKDFSESRRSELIPNTQFFRRMC